MGGLDWGRSARRERVVIAVTFWLLFVHHCASTVESVRLDRELKALLARRAEADGAPVSDVIRDALLRHLKASGPASEPVRRLRRVGRFERSDLVGRQ